MSNRIKRLENFVTEKKAVKNGIRAQIDSRAVVRSGLLEKQADQLEERVWSIRAGAFTTITIYVVDGLLTFLTVAFFLHVFRRRRSLRKLDSAVDMETILEIVIDRSELYDTRLEGIHKLRGRGRRDLTTWNRVEKTSKLLQNRPGEIEKKGL